MTHKFTDEEVKEIIKLYQGGDSGIKIASKFQCNSRFIYKILKKMNVCIRTNSENKSLSREKFLEKVNKKFKNQFIYDLTNYKNKQSFISITHIKCGNTFIQTVANHLQSTLGGCNFCARKGENSSFWNPNREEVALNFKVCRKVSSILNNLLKKTNVKKNAPTELILGYTRTDLKNHLISHPNWINCKDKKWQIDHIFPVIAFINHDIINPKIISALDNLRPILAKENLAKNDKYEEEEFLKYIKIKLEQNDIATEDFMKSYEELISKYINPTSKYCGVYKSRQHKKPWSANIKQNGHVYALGYFASEEDAAKHYDYFSIKLNNPAVNFPDFDYSNFITISHGKYHSLPKNKYKGMHYVKNLNKWQVRITLNGKRLCLGYFTDEIEAALNYDYHVRKKYKDCYLNFPNYDFTNFIPQVII